MEAYDLSHKLAFAGRRSPVPFSTSPEFTNSVPGVPVLSSLRIFIAPELWSEENIFIAAREICRALGPTEQFDVGMTLAGGPRFGENVYANADTARLTKLNRDDPTVVLRIKSGNGDRVFQARFPRLQFEEGGEDYWRSIVAPGVVKDPAQP